MQKLNYFSIPAGTKNPHHLHSIPNCKGVLSLSWQTVTSITFKTASNQQAAIMSI